MAEKSAVAEKFELLRKIGRLRAEYWLLRAKEALMLLRKNPLKEILSEVNKNREERKRIETELAELRKKYDEIDKGGAR